MSGIVIGTAGHIDHGKTALVKALTGIDTDRLKEEKERGITIQLGYASLVLPDGRQAAIIDVPGHEKFVKQMLAGVTGIDLALLVVAAPDGIRPQTQEHLDIIRLLNVRKIIVAVSKVDLVTPEDLGTVHREILELLAATPYRQAPVIDVSAVTGQGLDILLTTIAEVVKDLPAREGREGLTRLPVDRVFSKTGFGTIVTGTLFNGTVRVGDLLEVPDKINRIKVRGLQIHDRQAETAHAGQRVALNLSGTGLDKISRGDVLAKIGWLLPGSRLDLQAELLENSACELTDLTRVHFHHGTKQALGRVFVLGQDRLRPGQKGFLQIVLEEPVVAVRGDSFIIRSYSPVHTIGGGIIIEPHAIKHKKRQANLLEEMVLKASGNLTKLAEHLLERKNKIVSQQELARDLGLSLPETRQCLEPALKSGTVREIRDGARISGYLHQARLKDFEISISQEIKSELRDFPLSGGLNKEKARTRICPDLSVREFNKLLELLEYEKKIQVADKQFLLTPDYAPQLPAKLGAQVREIMDLYSEAGWQLPDWQSLADRLALSAKESRQLLTYLLREGKVIQLNSDLYLPKEMLEEARERLQAWFGSQEELTVADFRDMLGTTRRVAVPLLECLDKMQVTRKVGVVRWAGLGL